MSRLLWLKIFLVVYSRTSLHFIGVLVLFVPLTNHWMSHRELEAIWYIFLKFCLEFLCSLEYKTGVGTSSTALYNLQIISELLRDAASELSRDSHHCKEQRGCLVMVQELDSPGIDTPLVLIPLNRYQSSWRVFGDFFTDYRRQVVHFHSLSCVKGWAERWAEWADERNPYSSIYQGRGGWWKRS